MSHFSVLVIGGNVEEQLAPYDENNRLETPEVVKELSDEDKLSMIEFYEKKGFKYPTFDELYENHGHDWNDNSYEKHDDIWVEVSTYNPKSKWDWYQLGGRWNGFLKLKEGTEGAQGELSWGSKETKPGHCDETIKKNIDVDGMRNDAVESAGNYYDKVMTFIKDTPEHIKWDNFLKRVDSGEITIDEARTMYHEDNRTVEESWRI